MQDFISECVLLLFLSSITEIEARLPSSQLMALCRNELVLKWMSTCDHLMYQALVEILIPDVLRPIPSKELSHTLQQSGSLDFVAILHVYPRWLGTRGLDADAFFLFPVFRCLDPSHSQLCQKPGRLAQ